jgi:hypothetical protein
VLAEVEHGAYYDKTVEMEKNVKSADSVSQRLLITAFWKSNAPSARMRS